MRILKLLPGLDIFEVIVGEMLNIEASEYYYHNGQCLSADDPRRVIGYPRVVHGNICDTIRAASGYIYVPSGTDLQRFREQLVAVLHKMQTDYAKSMFGRYFTIDAHDHVNIKYAPQSCDWSPIAPKGHISHSPRSIVCKLDDLPSFPARFVWTIQHIDQIDMEVTSRNIDQAISCHVTSIFYDGDDICSLEHNAVTYEFSLELLTSHKNIVPETVTLFAYGHPLLVELSDFWRDSIPDTSAKVFLRNITPGKVFHGELNEFRLRPVDFIETPTKTSTNICCVCRSTLWGYNYVIPDTFDAVAMCPLCLHSRPRHNFYESKTMYCVKFPLTIHDMIISPTFSFDKMDILNEAEKSIVRGVIIIAKMTVEYVLVGSKYVGITDLYYYLFTKLSNDPTFKGRRVFKLREVK